MPLLQLLQLQLLLFVDDGQLLVLVLGREAGSGGPSLGSERRLHPLARMLPASLQALRWLPMLSLSASQARMGKGEVTAAVHPQIAVGGPA